MGGEIAAIYGENLADAFSFRDAGESGIRRVPLDTRGLRVVGDPSSAREFRVSRESETPTLSEGF